MYAGVDEAGRGPVLGPLVVAGVAGIPADLPPGVTDSKKVSPRRRAELYDAISRVPTLRAVVLELPADELNVRMRRGESLNDIERRAFVDALRALGTSRAVVDTLGSRPEVFGAQLTRELGGACLVEARVGADASDPLVGAASILAKVARDRAVEAIAAELGADIGSGYPADPVTREFLKAWRTRSDRPPPHARTAWSTLADLGFGMPSLYSFESAGRRV